MISNCRFAKKHPRLTAILSIAIASFVTASVFSLSRGISTPVRPQDIGGAVGQHARDFSLERYRGHMTRLSDFTGQALLLDFWTTWDPTNEDDLAALERTFQKYKQNGFSAVAVHRTRSELRKTAEDYVKSKGFTFPVLFDTTGGVYDEFAGGLQAKPMRILIDRRGVIAEVAIGAREISEEAIEKALR